MLASDPDDRVEPKVLAKQPVFVVDVSNVILRRYRGTKACLSDLDRIRVEIDSRWPESRVILIADASLKHRIRETSPGDTGRYSELLNNGTVREAPAGTPADWFILDVARRMGGLVITDDMYRDHAQAYPDVVTKERLVPFDFIDEEAVVMPRFDSGTALGPSPSTDCETMNRASSVVQVPQWPVYDFSADSVPPVVTSAVEEGDSPSDSLRTKLRRLFGR